MDDAVYMSNKIYRVIEKANKILSKKKQTHRKKIKKPKAEQDWVYLIHHMHPPAKAEDMETLHHCILFEKKNMKGKKFNQKHVKDGKVFQHVLDIEKKDLDSAPEAVYCHLNNTYKIMIKEIDAEKWAVINGVVSLKKTKWSDQDKGSKNNITLPNQLV